MTPKCVPVRRPKPVRRRGVMYPLRPAPNQQSMCVSGRIKCLATELVLTRMAAFGGGSGHGLSCYAPIGLDVAR